MFFNKKKKILNFINVSKKAYNSEDHNDLISSNISFINVLVEEGWGYEKCNINAVQSYFVDYYLEQMNNGGFSQFIYNTQGDDYVYKSVEKGLEMITATNHLNLFKMQLQIWEQLSDSDKQKYLASQYFGGNTIRDLLDEKLDGYFLLEDENLLELNYQYLHSYPKLNILELEQMYQVAEAIVGHKITR